MRITEAALERLDEFADDAPDHVVERLRDRYGARVERSKRGWRATLTSTARPTSPTPGG